MKRFQIDCVLHVLYYRVSEGTSLWASLHVGELTGYVHLLQLKVLLFVFRLQKFKLNIANTVISQDNSSLMTMDTGQVLDLFTVDEEKKKDKPSAQQNEGGKASLKNVLENLGELWDEEQYETEYNLDNFIESLK